VRIAVDASYSTAAEPTGIGIYSERLLGELAGICHADRFLLCYRPKQFLQSFKSGSPLFRSVEPRFQSARRRLLQPPFPIPGADLFHALNQRVDHRPACRVVATFHDLFVMTSEYSTPAFRTRFTHQARRAAANSDLIIAVSQFTASQLQDLLHIPVSRIRVISHGVDETPPADENARENIILFVGALQERKNLVRLVKAFEHVPSHWRLILAGSTGGYGAPRILEFIARSTAAERIEVTGYLPEPSLAALYRRAAIFAFPSLDEGFGIPVLEAMAHGVPVLTSNRSALPEVAGGAALLVDPTREGEVEDGLFRLATDEQLRDELRRLGYRRAAQFTWRKSAEATYKVYRELMGS
jgi:glycosyltransferase involved in cell wall biosynthesis